MVDRLVVSPWPAVNVIGWAVLPPATLFDRLSDRLRTATTGRADGSCWARSPSSAARLLAAQGIGVTVVDPGWAVPVPAKTEMPAAEHRLVVTVEGGGRSGGVGAAGSDRLSGTGGWPTGIRRSIRVPAAPRKVRNFR